MVEVYSRIYEVIHPNGHVEHYETVSVVDSASKTRRMSANSQLTDARSILNTQATSVKARIGFNGAVLKLACLLRNQCTINVVSFGSIGGPFGVREDAEKFRDEYLSSYSGNNTLLGKAGFRFASSSGGKVKKNTFYQPISGDKEIATNRIQTLITDFAMTIDLSAIAGMKMADGTSIQTLGQIIFNGAYRLPNVNNFVMINNVRIEQGEFNNYGEIFKKLLDAQIIN